MKVLVMHRRPRADTLRCHLGTPPAPPHTLLPSGGRGGSLDPHDQEQPHAEPGREGDGDNAEEDNQNQESCMEVHAMEDQVAPIAPTICESQGIPVGTQTQAYVVV